MITLGIGRFNPRVCYKDSSSSGPSSGDSWNPLSAFTNGGGGGSAPLTSPDLVTSVSQGFSGPPNAGTAAAAYNGGGPLQFGFSTPFSSDTTATSGAGQPGGDTSGIFASLGNANGSNPLSLAAPGAGGTGNALDNVAAGGTPGGGQIAPLGGGASAASTAAPTGIAGSGLPSDPTQQKPATGAPNAAIPPAGGSGSGGLSLENLVGSAEKSITSNPLGILAAGGGLAYSVMSGKQISDNQQALQQQAAQLSAQGQQMAAYLQSGNLPPGLKAGLDQATAAAKAKIVSNYAAQGMSTDPSQNSTLAQQLALVDQQAIITTAQIGQQLFSTGVQESGLASGLYTTLANLDQTNTARIGQAIASMAAALSPSKGGLSLNLTGKSS